VAGFNSHWQMTQDFTDNVALLSQAFTAFVREGERPSMTPFIKLVKKADEFESGSPRTARSHSSSPTATITRAT